MEKVEVLIEGRTKARQGNKPAGTEFVKTMTLSPGLFWPGWVASRDFSGVTLEAGSKLSVKMEEAGYIIEGHMDLTAKVVLSMGSAKRKG